MPFNINTFKTNGLVYGGARPSLFNVVLSVPPNIGISTTSVQKFSFMCKSAELPPFSVAPINVGYFGRKIKVAGDRIFTDWNVSVMNDEDFAVRSLFEMWSNSMNRLVSNVRDTAVDDEGYKADFQVNQYSKEGELLRQYTMTGAWPANIGAIALDWDSTNSIEMFPVSFSYDWFEPSVESNSKAAGGINTYISTVDQDGPLGPS